MNRSCCGITPNPDNNGWKIWLASKSLTESCMGYNGSSVGGSLSLGRVPGSPDDSVCKVSILDSKQPTINVIMKFCLFS